MMPATILHDMDALRRSSDKFANPSGEDQMPLRALLVARKRNDARCLGKSQAVPHLRCYYGKGVAYNVGSPRARKRPRPGRGWNSPSHTTSPLAMVMAGQARMRCPS